MARVKAKLRSFGNKLMTAINNHGYNQAHDIIHVRLLMYRTGFPGNLTVGIRNTVAGNPAGVDIANVTVNANTFTAVGPGLWYQFNFTASAPQALATLYAIVIRAPGAGGGNWVNWRIDTTAATYTGGQGMSSPDSGLNWFPYVGEDFMFGCWGEIL